jgi:hypothetical protein
MRCVGRGARAGVGGAAWGARGEVGKGGWAGRGGGGGEGVRWRGGVIVKWCKCSRGREAPPRALVSLSLSLSLSDYIRVRTCPN